MEAPAGWPAASLRAISPPSARKRKGRDGEQGGPVQHPAQRPGELRVRHRVWRRQVQRAVYLLILHRKGKGASRIRQADPAPPLASAAQPSGHSKAERGKHLGQRAAVAVQHQRGAHLGHPNPGHRRRLRRVLPVAADLGQKSQSRLALLHQFFVAAAAVIADGRAADQRPRSAACQECLRRRPGEVGRSLDPAAADFRLGFLCPQGRHRPSRQMHDHVKPGNPRGFQRRRPACHSHVAGARLRRIANQTVNLVPPGRSAESKSPVQSTRWRR